MNSTNYYGSRFQRKLKIKPLVRLLRSSRKRHIPLGSADSNTTLTEAVVSREGDDRVTDVEIEASEAAEDRAVPSRQSYLPAVTLTHIRTEEVMSRVQLENILREQAIHLASLIYPDEHLKIHRFDVCTSTKDIVMCGEVRETYITRAIAFADASNPTWHVVKQGAGNFLTLVESLESFIRELRRILEAHAAPPSKRWVNKPGSASRSDQPLIDFNTHITTGAALFRELQNGL